MAFARPGNVLLGRPADRAVAARPGTALVQCWKPVHRWADADGNRPLVNAYLAQCAQAVKRLARPLMIVLHHEPENDVGQAGTTRQYRTMYQHVHKVFTDNGVSNVVWAVGYMNYPKWFRLLPELWPTNVPVGWVWWNAYGSTQRQSYIDNMYRFYDGLLTDKWFPSAGTHWGVREWGVTGLPDNRTVQYFKDATYGMNAGMFPRVKAHMIFDSPGTHKESGLRIGYNDNGHEFLGKAAAYAEFAHCAPFGPLAAPVPQPLSPLIFIVPVKVVAAPAAVLAFTFALTDRVTGLINDLLVAFSGVQQPPQRGTPYQGRGYVAVGPTPARVGCPH